MVDKFGNSVSISGNVAIVGAPYDDDMGTESGAAYIYDLTASGWTQVAKLTADDGMVNDMFGCSVSISGNTAIVGAYDHYETGSAYIFKDTGSGWTQVARITGDDSEADDHFGHSVSICKGVAIVGASGDDTVADSGHKSWDHGSAYIFEDNGSGWSQVAKLRGDDSVSQDLFGHSVDLSGNSAIIGAIGDDCDGWSSGSAYVFENDGSQWNQVAKLIAADGEEDDRFGSSVSIDGNSAIVGAIYDDDNGNSSGSAYIFENIASNWNQVDKLTAATGMPGGNFGCSVSISGNMAMVGARYCNEVGNSSGSAYIFRNDESNWTRARTLFPVDGEYGGYFGSSVSISDTAFIVGEPGNDNGSAFLAPTPPTVDLQAASDNGISNSDNFTNDNTPTFDVIRPAGSPYFRFYIDETQVSGDYETGPSYTSAFLPDGTYSCTTVSIDTAGNESPLSMPASITIETVAPDPLSAVPDLQATSDNGISDSDNITNDSTPTFDIEAGFYFNLYRGTERVLDYLESGSHTVPPQPDGTHDYMIVAIDEAGNESAPGDPLSVTIDTIAPEAPDIATDLQATSDSGVSDTDNITNDNTPTFDIVAESYYRLYRDTTLVSEHYETANTFTTSVQPDGTFDYTLVAVDIAGNESLQNPMLGVTIDTTAPSDFTLDLLAADDTGSSDTDNITNDTIPTFGLSGGNGASFFRFYVNGSQVSGDYESVGTYTLAAQPDGVHECTAIAVDIAGNESIQSSTIEVTVDTIAPDTPDVIPDLQAASDTGISDADNITNDRTPVFDAAGVPYYFLYRDGTKVSDDYGTGSYSAPTQPLGTHDYAIVAVDVAGNESALGEALSVTIDTEEPEPSDTALDLQSASDSGVSDSDNITSDSTPTFDIATGTYYRIYRDTTLVSGDFENAASFTVPPQPDGTYNYTTRIVDIAGNESYPSPLLSVTIDTQATLGSQQLAKLIVDDGYTKTGFGGSVSIDGNLAIVGAYEDYGNSSSSGSAYIFEATDAGWVQVAKLIADDGSYEDQFGYSVSISGNVAIVGANGVDGSIFDRDSGAAYIFEDTGSGWTQVAKLIANDGDNDDEFGSSVSISGNVAIVGVPGGYSLFGGSGSAYIFEDTGSGWTQAVKLTVGDGPSDEQFGQSVSIDDGVAVVGAPSSFESNTAGSCYIYEKTDNDWMETAMLTPDDGLRGDNFGSSVSLDDNVVIIGASSADINGIYNVGAAYIFENTGSDWDQVAKLTADDVSSSMCFGQSVSISNNMAIVGIYADNRAGSAYIFEQAGIGWTQVDKIAASDGAAYDNFGRHVAISGNVAVVGAPKRYYHPSSPSSAYVFSMTPIIDLQSTSDTGLDATDNTTADNTPTFNIFGMPYFRISRDGEQITGDYETGTSYPETILSDGTYGYTIHAVDAAGNVSQPSPVLNITIDTQTPLWLPGDANLDDIVNDVDAAILAINWQTQSGATWFEGDFNDDGRVDDIDATIMAANWQVTIDPPLQFPGDANGDGSVDVSDLGILATNYGTDTGAEWGEGDYNGDGMVDVSDLGILATNYGHTLPPDTSSTGTAEPEIVSYDLDNDGWIGLGDLAFFASVYGEKPGSTTDCPYAYAADFDRSGNVDLGDLALFSANYQTGQPGDSVASASAVSQSVSAASVSKAGVSTATMVADGNKLADDDLAILARHWMMAVDDMDDDEDDTRSAVFAEFGATDDALGLLE